jgi:lysozyme family protein
MADFELAVARVFKNEGGYVNDPHDSGGETNFGITRRYLQSVGRPCDDMKSYTQDQAKEEYRRWWDTYQYDLIEDNTLATSVFTAAVNIGQTQAIKLLQRCCNAMLIKPLLQVDGVFGLQTEGAVNTCADINRLLYLFRNSRADFYRSLVDKNPKQYKRFLAGWLKVAYT